MTRTAGALVSVVLVSAVLVVTAPPQDADAVIHENVVHWNIWGTCGQGGTCGSEDSINTLAFMVGGANPKPFTITVNEICNPGQFNLLAFYLASVGYTAHFTRTNYPTNCGGGENPKTREFGNAIFQLGQVALQGGTPYTLPSQTGSGNPNDDTRKLTCMHQLLFGILRRGCVTHLDPSASPQTVTNNQNAYVVDYLQQTMSGIPTAVGADLNLTSPAFWGTNWRSTGGGPTYSSWYPYERLDWLFGSKLGHTASGSPGIYCNYLVSDHCLITGDHVAP
jgi:hypothetical protein